MGARQPCTRQPPGTHALCCLPFASPLTTHNPPPTPPSRRPPVCCQLVAQCLGERGALGHLPAVAVGRPRCAVCCRLLLQRCPTGPQVGLHGAAQLPDLHQQLQRAGQRWGVLNWPRGVGCGGRLKMGALHYLKGGEWEGGCEDVCRYAWLAVSRLPNRGRGHIINFISIIVPQNTAAPLPTSSPLAFVP